MNEYQMDANVCPSSLNEDGIPSTQGVTAHLWDFRTGICNECGQVATNDQLLDGLKEYDDDEVIELKENLTDFLESGKNDEFIGKLHLLLEVERELSLRETN